MQRNDTIPAGLCQCGCGLPTNPSKRNQRGYERGEYSRFIRGHSLRRLNEKNRNTVQTIIDRVVVDAETGCWIWQGAITPDGYGKVSFNNRFQTVHLLLYRELVGPVPEGLELDHKCRNRSCANPAHLEPVTNVENHRRSPQAKLSPHQIPEIREMAKTMSHRAISEHFGVCRSLISGIVRGEKWGDIQ